MMNSCDDKSIVLSINRVEPAAAELSPLSLSAPVLVRRHLYHLLQTLLWSLPCPACTHLDLSKGVAFCPCRSSLQMSLVSCSQKPTVF